MGSDPKSEHAPFSVTAWLQHRSLLQQGWCMDSGNETHTTSSVGLVPNCPSPVLKHVQFSSPRVGTCTCKARAWLSAQICKNLSKFTVMASPRKHKRKMDEWDVSDAKQTSSAIIHGVITQLSPIKRSKRDDTKQYFNA